MNTDQPPTEQVPCEPQHYERSPISILHEIFSQAELRPSFTFTARHGQQCCTLSWHCSVQVPKHGIGNGTSFSKKNAKSMACVDLLGRLGYDVSKFRGFEHSFKDITPEVVNVQTSIIKEKVDSECQLGRCFKPCCIKEEKPEPEDEWEPQFLRLYLAAISKEIKTKHATTRELNPCGYLEMLCRKVDCVLPTFTSEFNDVRFVTTVKLGPWTARGYSPNKKHSKYIATSSLLTGIEDNDKQH